MALEDSHVNREKLTANCGKFAMLAIYKDIHKHCSVREEIN